MDKIIRIINFVASGFLGLTIFFGYRATFDIHLFIIHIYIALFSASLAILGQVAIFFYLLGTGASIKEAANELSFGKEAVNEARSFKKKTFPFAMLAILLVIATTAMGGAAHTGVVLPYVHGIVAWTALCGNIFAIINAGKYLKMNKLLIKRVIETSPQTYK